MVDRISVGQAFPHLLHFRKEALRFGIGLFTTARLEFLQELPLAGSQVARGFDSRVYIEITHTSAAKRRHTLASQSELRSSLRACRNGDPGALTIKGRDFYFTAQCRGRHRNGDPAIKV